MLPKLVFVLAVVAGGGVQTRRQLPASSASPDPRSVLGRVDAPATIELIDPVAVAAPVAGRIDRVLVQEGAKVHRGEVLATIVAEERGHELERADAEVSRARLHEEEVRARVREARVAAAARTATDAASTSHGATDVAAASARAAELAEARAEIERAVTRSAELHRRALRAEVRAPIGGTLFHSELTAGASVRAKAPLFVIARNITGMRLVADVDEAVAASLSTNMHVTFSVAELPGRELEGKLVSVQKRRAVVEVSDPGRTLHAGMKASVTFGR